VELNPPGPLFQWGRYAGILLLPIYQRGLGVFGTRLDWKQVVARDAILIGNEDPYVSF
jgi:hypothetical protein